VKDFVRKNQDLVCRKSSWAIATSMNSSSAKNFRENIETQILDLLQVQSEDSGI